MEDILEKWSAKVKYRKNLIDFLFKKHNLKAGKICSNEIIKVID